VVAAWITVGGTVFVAVVSILAQFLTTRAVMNSERQKIAHQVNAEHQSQASRKRADILLEAISELLTETDPQVKGTFDYGRVVSLIHRAQLVLSHDDQEEAALNDAINRLGLALQNYIPYHQRPARERLDQLSAMLRVHADVATLAGKVLRR